MVSISYFLKFGFGPSSASIANASHTQSPLKAFSAANISPSNHPTASEDDDFELADMFLPNLEPTDNDVDEDDFGVQAASNDNRPIHTYDFQPWKPTIWKPHGIGRDLPQLLDTNTWDNLLITPPLVQIQPMWTDVPKLEHPRPYRPAALMRLVEIAEAWSDDLDVSSDTCSFKRNTPSEADAEVPPYTLEEETEVNNNNVDGSRTEHELETTMPLDVPRKQDNCYKSPDPMDLPPPNFVLIKSHRGMQLCFYRPSEHFLGHVDDAAPCRTATETEDVESLSDDTEARPEWDDSESESDDACKCSDDEIGYDADIDDTWVRKPPRKLIYFDNR